MGYFLCIIPLSDLVLWTWFILQRFCSTNLWWVYLQETFLPSLVSLLLKHRYENTFPLSQPCLHYWKLEYWHLIYIIPQRNILILNKNILMSGSEWAKVKSLQITYKRAPQGVSSLAEDALNCVLKNIWQVSSLQESKNSPEFSEVQGREIVPIPFVPIPTYRCDNRKIEC